MEENKDLIQVDIFGLSLSSTVSGGGYAIILKEVRLLDTNTTSLSI